MFGKSCLIGILSISASWAYAANGTGSIGTVSARGDMRVDGYTVSGNGTLFDGTTVETGQASATLRLNSGTEITLSTNSHGVVYSNHLVLLQGKSQLRTSNSSFLLEADGLRVAPGGPNTLGVVALSPAKTVDVAAVTGELRIVNNVGLPLYRVSTGAAFSFPSAQDQQPAGATSGAPLKEIEGDMSAENGNYYVTDIDGTKYELVTGNNIKKYVGKNVAVAGFVQSSSAPNGATQLIVTAIQLNGASTSKGAGAGGGGGSNKGVLIGVAVAGGAAAGIGIALSEGGKKPASP